MGITVINTNQAPAAIGPYSQAIAAGGFLFVSGQLGIDPKTGELVSSVFEDQAQQVFANLRHILEAAGCALNQVAAVDVFLTDMAMFSALNGLYAEFFQEHRPARAAIQVSRLPKDALIEIKCIACLNP